MLVICVVVCLLALIACLIFCGKVFPVVFEAIFVDFVDVFEVFVEMTDALAAVSIHDVDVAVGRNRHVGGVGPIELLRRAPLPGHVADLVKDLSFEVGFVNARADFWRAIFAAGHE